jgi:hypothetical protein
MPAAYSFAKAKEELIKYPPEAERDIVIMGQHKIVSSLLL